VGEIKAETIFPNNFFSYTRVSDKAISSTTGSYKHCIINSENKCLMMKNISTLWFSLS